MKPSRIHIFVRPVATPQPTAGGDRNTAARSPIALAGGAATPRNHLAIYITEQPTNAGGAATFFLRIFRNSRPIHAGPYATQAAALAACGKILLIQQPELPLV
jgi:hypothetical protein